MANKGHTYRKRNVSSDRTRNVRYPIIDMHDIQSIVEVETILKLLTLCIG